MLKTDKIIVVEGRYDKIKLSSLIDAVIIETEGFSIFKDKEKQKLLRKLAENKEIVVLTDSDSAGFVIRNFIGNIVPHNKIINAYIPDVYGKEKRKAVSSKEGKLGVEGVSADIIREALAKAGVVCRDSGEEKRLALLKYLDLPERLTTNAMLDIINSYMTYDDYKTAINSL